MPARYGFLSRTSCITVGLETSDVHLGLGAVLGGVGNLTGGIASMRRHLCPRFTDCCVVNLALPRDFPVRLLAPFFIFKQACAPAVDGGSVEAEV